MSTFCKCGRFLDVTDDACACVNEVCDYVELFANLDSTETSWGQQPLVNETFTNAKNRNFKGIRIPGKNQQTILSSLLG
jgi:hypothetical protein